MLSVLMQVFMIISIGTLVWCFWGYSEAFTAGSGVTAPFFGSFTAKAFLHGVDSDHASPRPSRTTSTFRNTPTSCSR